MGTRNKHRKENEVIGSVTAEVIERCVSPVLIIPEHAKFDFNDITTHILFTTNFDERTLNSIERMMLLFKKLDIKLFFTHVGQSTNSWDEIKLSGIKNYFSKHYPEIPNEYEIIIGKEFIDEVEKQIKLLDINLVVINTHKKNLLVKFFNPGIARKMVFQSNIPIIVFHS